MFIFSILCYTHFYTISLLCKSYGYVIMHRYNETIPSNNGCGNIVFNMCYVRGVQNNCITVCTTFHHFNDLKFDSVLNC